MNLGKFFMFGLIAATFGYAYADDDAEILLKRKKVTSQYYVDTEVAKKQPAVQAQNGNYVVMYPNGTSPTNDGQITARHVSTTLSVGSNGTDGVAATANDIPTVGAVNSGLGGKQAKLSNTSGKLVTYGNSEGAVGAEDVYNSSSAYNGQSTALVRAAHVNTAVVNGFDGLLTCNSWDTGHTGDDAYCLTYGVNTNLASGVYVPQPAAQSGN